MRIKESLSRRVYLVCNYIFVGVLAVVCIYPMLHVLAISLSSTHAVNAGEVNLLPVGFQLDAYKFVTQSKEFYTSFGVSVRRTLLGVVVNMTLTVLAGYPLSKSKAKSVDAKLAKATKWVGAVFVVLTLVLNCMVAAGL